jgi:hypothetical protein
MGLLKNKKNYEYHDHPKQGLLAFQGPAPKLCEATGSRLVDSAVSTLRPRKSQVESFLAPRALDSFMSCCKALVPLNLKLLVDPALHFEK